MNPSSRGSASKFGAGPRLFCGSRSGRLIRAAELLGYGLHAAARQTREGHRVRAGAEPAVLHRGGVRLSGAGGDPLLEGRAALSRLGGADHADGDSCRRTSSRRCCCSRSICWNCRSRCVITSSPCGTSSRSSRGVRGCAIGQKVRRSAWRWPGFLVWLLYLVVRRSPRRWWFYGWLVSIPLLVFARVRRIRW